MRTYLGSPTNQPAERDLAAFTQAARRPLRILFSYHYYRDEDIGLVLKEKLAGLDCDVFADSGAYSAWTTGTPITVDEYVAWLERWHQHFTCAAALDVIGNAEGSFNQTETLRNELAKRGIKTPLIPVFHSNDEGGYVWLQRYLDAGYDYIGISPTGAIYGSSKLMHAWLARAFAMRPEQVKYHGFGVTGWRTLKSFPWYSVDSSSWTSGFRYASLPLFDPKRGEWDKIDMRDDKSILKHGQLLQTYGLRGLDVRSVKYDRNKMVAACVLAWQMAEEWLTRWHKTQARSYLGTVAGNGTPNSPAVMGKSLRGES